jgi:hypothetical protein
MTTNTAGLPRSGCTSDPLRPLPNPLTMVNPHFVNLVSNSCIQKEVGTPMNALRMGGAGAGEILLLGGGLIHGLVAAGIASTIELGKAAVDCAMRGEYIP